MVQKVTVVVLLIAFMLTADPITTFYTGEVPGVTSENAELVIRYGAEGLDNKGNWQVVFIQEGSVDWSTVRYFDWNTDPNDPFDMDFSLTYSEATEILTFNANNLTDIDGNALSTSLSGVELFNSVAVSTIVEGISNDPLREITLDGLTMNATNLPAIQSGNHVFNPDEEFGGAIFTENTGFSSLDFTGTIDLDYGFEPGHEDMKVTMKFAKVQVPEPATAQLLIMGAFLIGAVSLGKRKGNSV